MKVDESVHKYLQDSHLFPDGNHSLYVGVKGGGCSGLQYVFEIVKTDFADPNNKYIPIDMFVVTDKKSSLFLKGCTLVYKMSVGASILVVENPNATSTCGCGESFSL